MFENNYNSETNTKETTYTPADEGAIKKKGRGKKVLKAIVALCCIAGISTASIAGYRHFSDNDSVKKLSVEKTEEPDKNIADDVTETTPAEIVPGTTYEMTSLFQLSRSENALSTQEIYKKMLPSVVGIKTVFSTAGNSGYGFYGNQGGQAQGTGTGIVISSDGYVITNAHVIYNSGYNVDEVTVLMHDETEYTAEIVGYDVLSDIAVLKVEASNLVPAEIGDSDKLNVGDSAVAIGNPLGFDLFGTLTVGYISGLNREIDMDEVIMELIQTDAAINSGNSGGPLINDCGQVIGINSMKMSNSYSEATIEGLGFAIPINDAMNIVNDLINIGYVTGRPQIGLTGGSTNAYYGSDAEGILVDSVNPGGAAEKAGILAGDIIVAANGESVTTVNELNKIKNKYKAGDTLQLTILRNKKYQYVDVVLEEASQPTKEETTTPEQTVPEEQAPQQEQQIPQIPEQQTPQQPPRDAFEEFFEEWWNEYSRR